MKLRHAVPLFPFVFLFTSTAPAADAVAHDGKALYLSRCGPCHLKGGGGTRMLSVRLGEERALLESRSDLVAPYIKLVVRNGLNVMPQFTRVELTNTELEAVVQYLTAPKAQP